MVYLKKIWAVLTWPYHKINEERKWRKRLKELRKRDPFIYR